MLGLNEFDFRAVWSPDVMFIISAIAVLYLLAVGSYRTRWFKQSTQVSTSKKIAMITGLALYYFAHGGPLDLLAHLMFSAHMLSMAISYLIVPPLLIYGLPDWMLRKALGTPKSSGFFHKLMTPIFSLLLFNTPPLTRSQRRILINAKASSAPKRIMARENRKRSGSNE